MKKSLLILMVLALTLADGVHYVHADAFAGNEDHYLELCSSTLLTKSKVSVCRRFNSYLKNKNTSLASSLADRQSRLKASKQSLKTLKKKITKLNKKINTTQKEIQYVQSSKNALEKQIRDKQGKMGQRLYSMQSMYNSETYALYLFKSQSLPDAFSRLASITQLTSYEDDLTDQISTQKQELEKQNSSLTASQATLTFQKQETLHLENQLVSTIAKNEMKMNEMKKNQKNTTLAQAKVNAALDELISSDSSSSITYTGGVGAGSETGKKIANIALSKLGARYWWTKTGPDYFDCSGFVYWVHNKAGIAIPRLSASGYANLGTGVSAASLSAGDIITFSYGSGVAHVGIYLGNGKFVHASGRGSGTVGQDPQQCVKVSSLSGRWLGYVHNYRRLY